MKVLVLSPPSRLTKNVVRDLIYGCWCKGKRIAGAKAPPINLLYIATVLKQQGHNVKLLDATAEQKTIEHVKSIILDYDAVVISTSTMSFREDAATLSELKQINPKLKTVIFGSHPTFMPKDCLSVDSVDVIVRREPDFIIRDLINAMEKGDKWKAVKGIGYRENKRIRINPPYPWIENLDELPIPDRSLLPRDLEYFNPLVKRIPYTTAMSSRACPSRCIFCTVPAFYGTRIAYRSASNVLEELRYIQDKGYKEVWFRDETFTIYEKRNRELMESMIKEGIDLTWIANARVNNINMEMLGLMKRAGCHIIKFGVESGVQGILNNLKKGITVEQTRNAFRLCREVGMDTHAHMMLGNPGETEETIRETIRFVKEIRPTTVTFGICTPYAGTKLFEMVADKNPEIRDGSGLNLADLHEKGFFNQYFTNLTNEKLEEYLHRAYREFYFRPGYILGWLRRIKSMDEFRRLTIAGANVLSFTVDIDSD